MNVKTCIELVYVNMLRCLLLLPLIYSFALQDGNCLLSFMWFGILSSFFLCLFLQANLEKERLYNRLIIAYTIIFCVFAFLYAMFSPDQDEQTALNFVALLIYLCSYMPISLQLWQISKYIKSARKSRD